MTLRLAAFQHFCARFADAFLTSLNPLTYERADVLAAFEEENEVHEPCPSCDGEMDFVPPYDRPRRQRPPDHAAGVEAPTPPAAFQLPMYDAKDLIDIGIEFLPAHRLVIGHGVNKLCRCICGMEFDNRTQHDRHVLEPVVSAWTYELQGLAYDQSHPET